MPGDQFTIGGYGMNGGWNVRQSKLQIDSLSRTPRFFRGYNEIYYFYKNILYFTMDRNQLKNEASIAFGDSGSGALIEIPQLDGSVEKKVAGVCSHS